MRCLFWIVSSLNCKTEPCLQLFPTVKRRWSLRSKWMKVIWTAVLPSQPKPFWTLWRKFPNNRWLLKSIRIPLKSRYSIRTVNTAWWGRMRTSFRSPPCWATMPYVWKWMRKCCWVASTVLCLPRLMTSFVPWWTVSISISQRRTSRWWHQTVISWCAARHWLPKVTNVPPLSCPRSRLRWWRTCCRKNKAWWLSSSTNATLCSHWKATAWCAVLSKDAIPTTTLWFRRTTLIKWR